MLTNSCRSLGSHSLGKSSGNFSYWSFWPIRKVSTVSFSPKLIIIRFEFVTRLSRSNIARLKFLGWFAPFFLFGGGVFYRISIIHFRFSYIYALLGRLVSLSCSAAVLEHNDLRFQRFYFAKCSRGFVVEFAYAHNPLTFEIGKIL